MNSAGSIIVYLASAIAALGAMSRFVMSIISYIKTLIDETKANTTAVKNVGSRLDSGLGNVQSTLTDHENRITKLEGR